MYHLDPLTQEPVHCKYSSTACPLAQVENHYGSISEAVRERLAIAAEATLTGPKPTLLALAATL